MISIMLFGAIIIYGVVALFMVKRISRSTESRAKKVLSVAIFTLLPTWDVLLGSIVYYPLSLFWPKEEIYKTVHTDSIYYDIGNVQLFERKQNHRESTNSENFILYSATDPLIEGFRFVETKVTHLSTEIHGKRALMKPRIYRCHLPGGSKMDQREVLNSMICTEVSEIKSRYVVRKSRIELGTTILGSTTICDRQTEQALAEFRFVVLRFNIPFFNWLRWGSLISPSSFTGVMVARSPIYNGLNFETSVLIPNGRKD